MNYLLEEYLNCERLLSKFFNIVNYCRSEHCFLLKSVNKVGCCTQDFFLHEGLINEWNLRSLNNSRIKLYGSPDKNNNCGYNNGNGCVLKTHKNPFCLSYVCNDYKQYLLDTYKIKYDSGIVRSFLEGVLTDKLEDEEITYFKSLINSWINKISK
jgi:hypothetical protein